MANDKGIDVVGHDERNLAALIFLPAPRRIEPDAVHFSRKILGPAGKKITLTCRGMPTIGIPHGSDHDVLVALINAYMDHGCPDDGYINITAYGLLKMLNAKPGGYEYKQLTMSLVRLHTALFTVSDGWFDKATDRYTTASFHMIKYFERTHAYSSADPVSLDSRSVLRIGLADPLSENIRRGYIKPLNMQMYQRLPASDTRALYRHLDNHLETLVSGPAKAPYTLTMDAESLAALLGMTKSRSDALLRALKRIHTPLLTHGYLKKVDYIGRGRNLRINYTYGQMGAPVDTALVELLLKEGVHRGPALKFVRVLGDGIHTELARFKDQIRQGGVKDHAAYLSRMLANACEASEALALQAIDAQAQVRHKARPVKAEAKPEAPEMPRLWPINAQEAAEAVFTSFLLRSLQRSGLTLGELDQLKAMVANSDITADTMHRMATRSLHDETGMKLLRSFLT